MPMSLVSAGSGLISPTLLKTRSWIGSGIPLLIGACTFFAFSPALENGLLAWDDVNTLLVNTDFRGLGLQHLTWMFTTYYHSCPVKTKKNPPSLVG